MPSVKRTLRHPAPLGRNWPTGQSLPGRGRPSPVGHSLHRMSDECPACGQDAAALSLTVEETYRLWRCLSCGSEFFRADDQGRAPRESAYWEPYKFSVYENPAVHAEFERRYERVVAEAERLVGPIGSVLDIGCGIGNFLSYATDRGMRAVGADVEEKAVDAARSRGLEAYVPGVIDCHVADGSLDAATMWDVIEHLLDPQSGLEAMVRKVRPGGALIFETPNAGFPARRAVLSLYGLTGRRVNLTDPLYYLEHRCYFTLTGMKSLLERCGCRLVWSAMAPSPRQKMATLFELEGKQDLLKRALSRAWPLIETATTRARLGNKLLIVGQRLPES